MTRVQKWMAENHPGDPILFVFEKGDANQDQLTKLLNAEGPKRAVDPIFMEKEWLENGIQRRCLPLQAADFIAYEHAKALTDYFVKRKSTVRGSMYALTKASRSVGNKWMTLEFATFKMFVDVFRIPRRDSGQPAKSAIDVARELSLRNEKRNG